MVRALIAAALVAVATPAAAFEWQWQLVTFTPNKLNPGKLDMKVEAWFGDSGACQTAMQATLAKALDDHAGVLHAFCRPVRTSDL